MITGTNWYGRVPVNSGSFGSEFDDVEAPFSRGLGFYKGMFFFFLYLFMIILAVEGLIFRILATEVSLSPASMREINFYLVWNRGRRYLLGDLVVSLGFRAFKRFIHWIHLSAWKFIFLYIIIFQLNLIIKGAFPAHHSFFSSLPSTHSPPSPPLILSPPSTHPKWERPGAMPFT